MVFVSHRRDDSPLERPVRNLARETLFKGIGHARIDNLEFETEVRNWLAASYPVLSPEEYGMWKQYFHEDIEISNRHGDDNPPKVPADVAKQLGMAKLGDPDSEHFELVRIIIRRRVDEYVALASIGQARFLLGQWTERESAEPISFATVEKWIKDEAARKESQRQVFEKKRERENRNEIVVILAVLLAFIGVIVGGMWVMIHSHTETTTICSVEPSIERDDSGIVINTTDGTFITWNGQAKDPSRLVDGFDDPSLVYLARGTRVRISVTNRSLPDFRKKVADKVTVVSLGNKVNGGCK
jgi:hypothetical protein